MALPKTQQTFTVQGTDGFDGLRFNKEAPMVRLILIYFPDVGTRSRGAVSVIDKRAEKI
jgi:hypothetical protein